MSVESGRLAPEAVRSMFDRISPVYDAMNRTMTMGLDQRWRRATVAAVVQPGDRVLDACCGTGDLAVAALQAGATVTGLDFSERMLERARRKSDEIEWVQGDAREAAVRGRELRRRDGRLRRAQPRRPRARPRRAAARAAAGRARGDPRDHAAARAAGAVLPALVRRLRAAARQGPSRRLRLHVPSRQRAPFSRPRRARRPPARGRRSRTSAGARSRAGSSRCTSESPK